MNFESIPLFSAMKTKLNYLSERQGVLAENVANADTPDYKARDVAEPFGKKLALAVGQLPMKTTNQKHLTGGSMAGGSGKIIFRDSTYELNPIGNNVSIEEEMAKIAENHSEYQKVINIYRKSVDMFKTAIGKTNG